LVFGDPQRKPKDAAKFEEIKGSSGEPEEPF
jgi:hypothetical protein